MRENYDENRFFFMNILKQCFGVCVFAPKIEEMEDDKTTEIYF